MTLFDVDRLFKYWQRYPAPTDLMRAIAQTLGIELPSVEPKQYMTGEAFADLVKRTGGRIEGLSQIGG